MADGATAFTVTPPARQFGREAAGQGPDAGLGSRVVQPAGGAGLLAGDRRQVDDAAAAAQLHVCAGDAAAEEAAAQVDGLHLVPPRSA